MLRFFFKVFFLKLVCLKMESLLWTTPERRFSQWLWLLLFYKGKQKSMQLSCDISHVVCYSLVITKWQVTIMEQEYTKSSLLLCVNCLLWKIRHRKKCILTSLSSKQKRQSKRDQPAYITSHCGTKCCHTPPPKLQFFQE